ncbi:MAG: SMP-30/gluconolactonase/LRE family protein [Flammeovirgaceae bacterium]
MLFLIMALLSCQPQSAEDTPVVSAIGRVIKLDDQLDAIIDSASFELLGTGYTWAEGPVWIESEQALLFSDVPNNTIFKWTEGNKVKPFLTPSGSTDFVEKASKEGANGLILDAAGRLILCQHGDRRVARLNASFKEPTAEFESLATAFEGKLFNSPNDIAMNKAGQFFFTDPPYGLEKEADRELNFQGVYRIDTTGAVVLLTDKLSRPNGIGLSPDESVLYVANSDPEKAIWMAYDLDSLGNIRHERVFYDATPEVLKARGLPDGLKVDQNGNVFATGPGGVWIFSPEGKHLGTISIYGVPVANCAFNAEQSELFLTAQNLLIKVSLKSNKS